MEEEYLLAVENPNSSDTAIHGIFSLQNSIYKRDYTFEPEATKEKTNIFGTVLVAWIKTKCLNKQYIIYSTTFEFYLIDKLTADILIALDKLRKNMKKEPIETQIRAMEHIRLFSSIDNGKKIDDLYKRINSLLVSENI